MIMKAMEQPGNFRTDETDLKSIIEKLQAAAPGENIVSILNDLSIYAERNPVKFRMYLKYLKTLR